MGWFLVWVSFRLVGCISTHFFALCVFSYAALDLKTQTFILKVTTRLGRGWGFRISAAAFFWSSADLVGESGYEKAPTACRGANGNGHAAVL